MNRTNPRGRGSLALVGLLLGALSCAGQPGHDAPAAEDASVVPAFPASAESARGMVVTGSPYATEAGVRMLERGGNAIDAAVAAAFALAVAEPSQSGLGGRTQLLLRRADGALHAIDGSTEVPSGYSPDRAPAGETGHGAVAIPGTVAALTRVLAEHGTLPLAAVMAPAISWAEAGVVLPEGERGRLAELVEAEGLDSPLGRTFQETPSPDGGPPRLVQPVLARTLRAVAAGGAAAFYEGPIAETMASDLAANGGFVTLADLRTYRAIDSEVGRTRYGDLEVVGSYLPASGVTVAQILAILDRAPVPGDEVRWADAVARALAMGFEDRERAEGLAPARAVAWLTSDSLLGRRADEVATSMRAPTRVALGASTSLVTAEAEPPYTTHVSVADGLGNVIALTQSLGPTGGARVVTPELGFLYASTLGGYLTVGGPGYRPWSSQAPLIVLREGEPVLVAGGAGARRIVSALVSTVARWADGMPLDEAVAGPRLHPTGSTILVEEGWSVRTGLARRGRSVEVRDRAYFARLNLIGRSGASWTGVAEPGWSGSSAGGPRR